ncbi:MAG: FGGY-family carbohydrate kinase [Pseudomonadota bacterium]|nr:FGGY-family carbohydrate kinase [Pseudomonadota bacterium]MDP1903541.1 FGGY-family carbohydrate kinase [Pseudomonadota bacterium]MDP2351422.1 FGGY-family carbohydrate kinase [Pseudomonadota bacterium]
MMYLGIDFGTSGARACVMAPGGQIEDMARLDFGILTPDEAAASWSEVLFNLIAQVPISLRRRLQALAVDGTSATVLACDEALNTTYPPLLYNDARAVDEAEAIRRAAGPEHPAAAASSGLAKVLWLKQRLGPERAHLYLNQADWLSALLSGRPVSDYHNALKMGLDLESGEWPEWVTYLVDVDFLPVTVKPGTALALVERPRAASLGINPDCLVRAGTTDSIAAFLAAGVDQPGEAVTSLGSTLVLKLLSETRVDAGEFGIYSHWFGRYWLAGGASNAGGGVLRQHFSDDELMTLSARIEPKRPSGLDYYPLPGKGERFPVNDPELLPRLEPRPPTRIEFLQGMLEGLANIEARGYRKLAELGATPLKSVASAGGGARNEAWTRIRADRLQVPVDRAAEQEACYGAARLACFGSELFPGGGDD